MPSWNIFRNRKPSPIPTVPASGEISTSGSCHHNSVDLGCPSSDHNCGTLAGLTPSYVLRLSQQYHSQSDTRGDPDRASSRKRNINESPRAPESISSISGNRKKPSEIPEPTLYHHATPPLVRPTARSGKPKVPLSQYDDDIPSGDDQGLRYDSTDSKPVDQTNIADAANAAPRNSSQRAHQSLLYNPSSGHRRSASVHSHQSIRSVRSFRSSRSTRSTRSGLSTFSGSNASLRQRPKSKATKLAAIALSGGSHDCYVCGLAFTGLRCTACDTSYGGESLRGSGTALDFDLLRDLAGCGEDLILESVVVDVFSSVESVAATFYAADSNDQNIVNTVAVEEFYALLASSPSTCPMRAVLQGAQQTLHVRHYAPLTETELVYLLVVLSCPALTQCSMFIKITGPLQKLARYASLRSRACMVLELCAGLIAHAPPRISQLVVTYLANQNQSSFIDMLQLSNAYVGHRLNFHYSHKSVIANRPPLGAINRTTATPLGQVQPSSNTGGPNSPLRNTHGGNNGNRLSGTGVPSSHSGPSGILHEWYADDWRVAAMAHVLALFFQANSISHHLPTSTFYNTVADYYLDVRGDFDSWQASKSRKRARFAFCQYPFLLSMGAKTRVFEHAVRREVNMMIQRELLAALAANPSAPLPDARRMRTVTLTIRRTHLLEDSLRELDRWHHSLRRSLRIKFVGEQGIDAGGPKKEWFLMFFRDVMDPAQGLFEQDEESNYCWFSRRPPASAITQNVYEAAGIALGLALFNNVSIDLNVPPVLFKILLDCPYTLTDVHVLWPSLAQSLQGMLDYEGEDFEDALGMTFTAPNGSPLKEGSPPVTLESKKEFVELLIAHELENKSLLQFKKGFLTVACGNSLDLFQPCELEMLLRGDRKPIDVATLRQVTKYVHFGVKHEDANNVPVVIWFWDYFSRLDPASQAALLTFVTATDRLPATGIVNMRFRIVCLGPDSQRLPVAHTCFNELGLYRYSSRRKLEQKLHMAITESQGFDIK